MIIAKIIFYLTCFLVLQIGLLIIVVGGAIVLKIMIGELLNETEETRNKVKGYFSKRENRES